MLTTLKSYSSFRPLSGSEAVKRHISVAACYPSLLRVRTRNIDQNRRTGIMPYRGRLVPISEMYNCNLLVTGTTKPIDVFAPVRIPCPRNHLHDDWS